MNSNNLGVVFAPCTMYDPEDPSFGALSAPRVFAALIDEASVFTAVSSFPPSPLETTTHLGMDGMQTLGETQHMQESTEYHMQMKIQQLQKERDELKAKLESMISPRRQGPLIMQ